jgi:hypothetical protein
MPPREPANCHDTASGAPELKTTSKFTSPDARNKNDFISFDFLTAQTHQEM